MLERLVIRNLAVIEELELELHPGLTVLTGETGAGKSIIVDALNLLVGGRAASELLRSGEDKAYVQGVFTPTPEVVAALQELDLYEEPELIITREITSNRSICRVNGRVVNQTTLRELGTLLVDMHGQHEHQSLLVPEKHLFMVDSYIGEVARKLLQDLSAVVRSLTSCNREMKELAGDERERSRLVDLFNFQLQEIDSVKLINGEEDELKIERARLLNFEKLQSAVERAYTELYSGQGRGKAVVDVVGRIISDLAEVARIAPELLSTKETLEQASYLLDDAARSISVFKDELNFEPKRLEQIENRLDQISKLKRKYGDTVEQILAFRDEAAASLERIHGSAGRLNELELERTNLQKRYVEAANELRKLRTQHALELAAKAELELRDLGMPNARLTFDIKHIQDHVNALGTERMELLFSANAGEQPKPLSKIASGGEMSRVMLGLKAVFSKLDNINTLVFDEIDSGVGGKAAQAVAEKIAAVSAGKQVLCVTHLPQIAAVADNHLFIEKNIRNNRTSTRVTHLTCDARVRELARMLSGNESAVALKHAQELLSRR